MAGSRRRSSRLKMDSAKQPQPQSPKLVIRQSQADEIEVKLANTSKLKAQKSNRAKGKVKQEEQEEEEEDEEEEDEEEMNELEQRCNDLDESWETESIFEDMIEDLTEDGFLSDTDGINACTPSEAMKYRYSLRSMGPETFCNYFVESGRITAKKLLTAFGIKPPAFLEGREDHEYYGLLLLALTRELRKRAKLMKYNSVDDVCSLIQQSKNIVVITGAGISTSLGIPDFRSKDTGLYDQLAKQGLAVNDPQEVFDIHVFRDNPEIFFSVAKGIIPDQKRFTPTHAFIAELQRRNKLLTNYSQNIDNLESHAGVKPEKLIQCHGSFATATCQECRHKVQGETIFPDIKAGKIPRCAKCISNLRASGKLKRRRNARRSTSSRKSRSVSKESGDDDYDNPAAGIMKPDITFFGEPLPAAFNDRLIKKDRYEVDLVIVIGTSLKVAPVSEVVPFLPAHVPQIYISRTSVNHVNFDIDLLGDCDVVVAELCTRLGWDLKHEMIPPNQKVEVKPQEGYWSRHVFTASIPDSPSDDESAGSQE